MFTIAAVSYSFWGWEGQRGLRGRPEKAGCFPIEPTPFHCHFVTLLDELEVRIRNLDDKEEP
jgi:hypothetical protein